jgi:hypothetical protein
MPRGFADAGRAEQELCVRGEGTSLDLDGRVPHLSIAGGRLDAR